MRPTALLMVFAAALALAGCSGPSSAGEPQPGSTAVLRSVGCSQAIEQIGAPGPPLLFGVVAVPPARLTQAVHTGTNPWQYYRKYGLTIRADSPAVQVTVARTSRRTAAISWGSNLGAVSSLRILSCPAQTGLQPWNAYPGGFYLHAATGCVALIFQVGRRALTLRFAIGRSCGTARRDGNELS
jgi:hypothetical protein